MARRVHGVVKRALVAGNKPVMESRAEVGQTTPRDEYLERLVKYVPAEMISLYVAVRGAAVDYSGVGGDWALFFGLCLLTPLYVARVTREAGKPPAWKQIVVGTAAFAIWVFAIGGPFESAEWYSATLAGILLPLATFGFATVVPAEEG